jgi:hypothetical protein
MSDYTPGEKNSNSSSTLFVGKDDLKDVTGSLLHDPVELLDPRKSFDLLMKLLCAWFVFEMVIIMLAVGVKGYWLTAERRFDGMVTLFTLFVTAVLPLVESVSDGRTDYSWIVSVLVAIRSLRIVRAFRFLSFIDKNATLITSIIARSIHAAINILMVLFSFTYVYAIIGMYYYKGVFTHNNTDLDDTSYMGNTFGAVDQRCYNCKLEPKELLLEGEVKYLMGVTFEVSRESRSTPIRSMCSRERRSLCRTS